MENYTPSFAQIQGVFYMVGHLFVFHSDQDASRIAKLILLRSPHDNSPPQASVRTQESALFVTFQIRANTENP